MNLLLNLYHDDRGATAIEYGLILAMIAMAIIGAVSSVADGSIAMWTHVSDEVDTAMNGA